MTRRLNILTLTAVLFGATAVFVSAQRPAAPVRRVEYPVWETKILAPREVRPAHYAQVPQRDIEQAGFEGWELVAVESWVLRNEARGETRDTVTQVYPAYYFKRIRPDR
jgi:hypothetical protein